MSHAAVQKVDVDLSVDARIIHDLSFPPGDSVNDNTEPDHEIEVGYDGPEARVTSSWMWSVHSLRFKKC
jgi:hypothetical protein